MVNLISLLVVFPFVLGLLLLVTGANRIRRPLVGVGVVAVIAGSIALALPRLPEGATKLSFSPEMIGRGMLVAEVIISLYLLWVSVKTRKPLVALLALAQASLLLPLELGGGHHVEVVRNVAVDQFSVILALIIGLVGGLICLYAVDYMQEFHVTHHPELRDGRRSFFAILFLFLGAMFGLVFSNNLHWVYFFWEVTTLCSFWLIGYKGTEESVRNAHRALLMNLTGGLAFAAALFWMVRSGCPVEIDRLVAAGPAVALLPVALLAFAGITKSAQLPFSSWLLGAMVAPTPVSALLHSSTMVNAGVYLVLRVAPVLQGTVAGILVALVGALTFLTASLAAITTGDAKKVLAYSTIANLGLIVLCGGIGTHEAVWAGILLIVFHAIAKGLLFLCVGVVEHKLHSRNIDDMTGLIIKMPQLSVMLQIGMAGMFLAPFGMLISKYAVLKAVLDSMPLLAIFIVFGSAATLFFWIKWMGGLLVVTRPHANVEKNIGWGKWTALYALSALTFGTCMLFPLLSTGLIEPYVKTQYHLAQFSAMSEGNLIIMVIMLALVSLFPLSFLNYGRNVKVVDPYLGGANKDSGIQFAGSAGTVRDMSMQNYYLADILPEAKMMKAGVIFACVLLAGLLVKVVCS
jgi:ech hydrogenase subunit A